MNFAKLFREVRKDLGLTQKQMAKRLKLSQAGVCKIERGANKQGPRAETFIRLWQIIPVENVGTGCLVMSFMEKTQ